MTTITLLHNQSIIDIAIQYTGKAENCFEIALVNNISVSQFLEPGTAIKIPFTSEVNTDIDNDVVQYYVFKQLQPASEITEELIIKINPLSGINYWGIEENFIVQ
ncbi:Uncharacterised protein [Chryseobacterium nakagawai]|uniref:LysM domain-containing protein n=1 Tax=Chryseobacterium nakagawai TaxID=1241982 RepID=A0AAD0YM24_CHRNA|nr:hypothetical protein [Chryseobacterium nakagawai]AZA90913.1 hypothetical protein EG343_09840 [Chryseobacterium nakagawai]VEH22451.1 Uncharacterised protein [Chryseobacterium nakagawai]